MSHGLARAGSPAARLFACVVLVVSAATAPREPLPLIVAASVAMVTLIVARPPPSRWLRPLAAALLAILALLVPLAAAGRTGEAAMLGARSLSAVVLALAWTSSLSLVELGAALAALGLPSALTGVIVTMLRQLSTVQSQAKTLWLARKLRGARGVEAAGETLAALFARTAERAERAELAARLRGHELSEARRRAGLSARDAPLVALCLLLGALPHAVGRLGAG